MASYSEIRASLQACGLVSTILCFFSVIGAIYILINTSRIRRETGNPCEMKVLHFIKKLIGKESELVKKQKEDVHYQANKALFITDFVFWMSFCDFFTELYVGWIFSSVGFDGSYNANLPEGFCLFIAYFITFFLIGSASWNAVIAFSLLRILTGTSIVDIEHQVKYYHMFVWGTSFIGSLIPWFRTKGPAYGYVTNYESIYGFSRFQCWINVTEFQLCLYAPAMMYCFCALVLLSFTCYYMKTKHIQSNAMFTRLTLYTLAFVVTWSAPTGLRLRGNFTETLPEPYWVWLHHVSWGSVGLFNAIIWGTSNALKKEDASQKDEDITKFEKSEVTQYSSVMTDTNATNTQTSGIASVSVASDENIQIELQAQTSN